MEIEKMTVEEIETRKAEIKEAVEVEGADLNALEEEVRSLNSEMEKRKAEEAKKVEIREAVASETIEVKEITNYNEERGNKTMDIKELRSSEEYLNAYVKAIKTEDDSELRTMLTTNVNNGTVVVPTLVDSVIKHAWDKAEIAAKCTKLNLKGNIKVSFEYAGDDAVIHTEGSGAVNEESLSLGTVQINPVTIKKWIGISDEVLDMDNGDFINYIYEEITYRIAKKLDALIIADVVGAQTSSDATHPGQPAFAEALGLGTIIKAFSKLSDEATNPCIVMSKGTYAEFEAAKLAANYAGDIYRGMEIIFDDNLPTYSEASAAADWLIVGDFSGETLNYVNGDIALKFDDVTLATQDLVRVIGRIPVGHAVTAPNRFCRVKKPND